VAVTTVAMDITKEMEAATALEEEEERYRTLADATFEGIAIHDQGTILDVNSNITKISGYTREDLIGKNMFELLYPESIETARRNAQSDFAEPYEIFAKAKDGHRLELEAIGKQIPYKGRTVRVVSLRDVGERNRHQEALRRSEEMYRLVAENLHDVVWTMDLDLKYTYISPSVQHQRGFSPEEVMGQSLPDVMTPGSLEKVNKAVEDVLMPILAGDLNPKTSVTLDLDMYRKDGTTFLAEMSISMLLDDEDRPMGILGVTRDISERKVAEAAVVESEEKYRLLAENVEDIIFVLGQDLTFSYVSPSLEKLTGYTVEELEVMGWQDLLTPTSLEETMERIAEDVLGITEGGHATESSILIEAEVIKKSGGTVWTEVNVTSIPDDEGNIVKMMGVARDITERKRAESAIRESEGRYRLLAENVVDVIFVLGTDLTFSYISPSFTRLTGYTANELMEMGWQDMLTPSSLERSTEMIAENLIESMDSGTFSERSTILEMEVITKQGDLIWTEINLSLLKDPQGELRGILGVARDVTERKRTHEQFMEEKKRAELYLDLFGHDIRNINQGIMSYLELMLMRPSNDPTDEDYIKSVLEQATRINDLVAKVQRLTQLRTRGVETHDVDAQKIIHGAMDYVVAKYPNRTIEINTNEACSNHHVVGSNLLHDVFTSILDNAVRFNRNEPCVIDIGCDLSEDGRSMRFSFDDRGPGIPDAMKDRVFKRLDQPDVGVKGSGLGLTVVGEIIKRLSGRVWVEDRVPGVMSQGSRMVVELRLPDE
jgi:PAS domain S-box-containing protein